MFGLTLAEWASIGTITTAGVAVLAALFAGWQGWEIRRTRREQARPFVVVDVQPSAAAGNLLNLIVENVGTTVAYDVELKFTPPLKTTRDTYDIGDSVLVREGIPMLPPRRHIQALFDVSHERFSSDLPMRYDVVVEMKDSRGRKQDPQRYVIDLGHMYGLARWRNSVRITPRRPCVRSRRPSRSGPARTAG